MGTLLEIGLSNAIVAAVLAVPAAAAGLVCRRPALTHCLWLLVFLKLITPPLFPVHVSWPAGSQEPSAEEPILAAAEETGPVSPQEVPPLGADLTASKRRAMAPDAQPVEPEQANLAVIIPAHERAQPDPAAPAALPWLWIVAVLWPVGSLLWLSWMASQVFRFQRLLRHARLAPGGIQSQAQDLARRLGLKKFPAVWLVPGAVSPMLWAIGQSPRLLFPAGLLERLDGEQLETLLVHELAHFHRRDHWVRLLEIFVLGLYWWHPLVWWARRELREAEEQCCDAWVVWAQAGEGRAYALALMQTVAFFSRAPSPLPVAASGIGQVTHLRRRLTMIMQGKTPRSLSWLGGCAVLGLGLLLPVVPLWAQAPAKLADPSSRQSKIEILKQAIKILEDQETADKGKKAAAKDQNAAAIARAKATIVDAAKRVQAKSQELHQAEAQLQKAVAELARLQPAGNFHFDIRLDGQSGLRLKPDMILNPNNLTGELLLRLAKPNNTPKAVEIIAPAQMKLDFFRAKEKAGSDLEKKLDRLLKEVDDLRRELRGGKPRPEATPAVPVRKGVIRFGLPNPAEKAPVGR